MFNSQKQLTQALERKNISNKYHNLDYPIFLKAAGPFEVYDHAQKKGVHCENNQKNTNSMAQLRFQQELSRIKKVREKQREDFYYTKDEEDKKANYKLNLAKNNEIFNSIYLKQ